MSSVNIQGQQQQQPRMVFEGGGDRAHRRPGHDLQGAGERQAASLLEQVSGERGHPAEEVGGDLQRKQDQHGQEVEEIVNR
jgi:hypothetical protein